MVLDTNQRKIVESDADNILVIASAGSGKTRVLTERIKYLITQKDVPPKNIIAITFTNQAATEMIDRLSDVPGIEDAFVGTIHALAYRMLKSAGVQYKILDDELSDKLHLEAIEKSCSVLTKERYIEYTAMKSKYRLGIVDKDELKYFFTSDELDDLEIIEMSKASALYPVTIPSICESRGIITFDRLIKIATNYFKESGSEAEYVFVDELQDIANLEYKFILSLNAKNYFFVGDDWQSIYSFKGGDISIFRSLYRNKSYKKYYLSNNYRSTRNIIDYSMKVINKVSDKFKKEVNCIRKDEEGFNVITTKMHLDECLEYIKAQEDYKSWFILVRTNADLSIISSKAQKIGIPITVFRRNGATMDDINRLMSENTVKLLTVHSSKGLENKNVLLYGNFSLFNKCPSTDEFRKFKFEEEFKVFYVGVTRARDNLILVDTSEKFQNSLSNNLDIIIKGSKRK